METIYAFPGLGKTFAFEQVNDPDELLDISTLHGGELNHLHGKEKGDELWKRFNEGDYTPETLLVNLYDHEYKGSKLSIDRALLPTPDKLKEILSTRSDVDPEQYTKWLKSAEKYFRQQGVPIDLVEVGHYVTDYLR